MKKIIILITAFSLSGCIQNYKAASVETISNDISVHDSSYDKSIKIIGPVIGDSLNTGVFSSNTSGVSLRGLIDKKTGAEMHFLHFTIVYGGGWQYFKTVSFDNSDIISAKTTRNRVAACGSYGGCTYIAKVLAPIEKKKITESTNGLNVRVNSKSGHNHLYSVHQKYIDAYVEKVTQVKSSASIQ